MSCEVKPLGSIPDLKKVQSHLGFSQDDNWLNAIYYSLSPTGETIAFGHGAKLVIMNAHWSNRSNQTTYNISWQGELENPNEIITALTCLPIYGANVSTGADWTCLAVGLASGMVQFYADSGVQLFSQTFHIEPVQSIKAQSGKRIAEEIHVGYVSCLCILQGTHVFHILKGLKQSMSRTVTSMSSKTNISQFPDRMQCRKWEYRGKNITINDSAVVGSQHIGTFDYMLQQSLEGGFYTKCRSSPPESSLILGVGVKPYVGFYYAREGFAHAGFTDVAKAVASNVMSQVSGWLFKSQSQPVQEQAPQITPGEPMNCRFGLCDIQRQSMNVWLAPGHDLAVVSDNLSRVILVDCNRGIALRIWKGYRDPQCGFIKVTEKKPKHDRSERRKVLFLVIFAPRRSCLEIWPLQRGPKVAAFNVNKNGQLIYNSYGLMGVIPGAKTASNVHPCIFFDPSDDSFKEISVPFHCALTDGNSKMAKDLHLLRRIKMCLRGGDIDLESIIAEVESSCTSFQTDEIRLQCLEMLASNKRIKPLVLKKAIDVFTEQIQSEDRQTTLRRQSSESEMPNKSLPILLENYRKLVDFYIAMTDETNKHDSAGTSGSSTTENLSLILTELETIQKLFDLQLDQTSTQTNNRVTFVQQVHEEDFVTFLAVFNVESYEIQLKAHQAIHFSAIGFRLFGKFLKKGHSAQSFVDCARDSYIASEDFFKMLLYYWLEKAFSYSKIEDVIEDMTRLASIIEQICDLAGDAITFDYNGICPWWQKVREMLLESKSATQSLLAAIVCRHLSNRLSKRESSPEDNIAEEAEIWEQFSQEAAQWSLLIGKLEDISILGAVLHSPQTTNQPEMPSLPYDRPDCSLFAIFSGGKGIVAELVAKWLTNSEMHPKKLLENYENADSDIVVTNVQLLREHFPFSLQSGVLLCQMTWDYFCHWSNNLPSLEYLRAGLKCLEQFQTDDLALKHGLCCMIWNAHLKIPLEATKKLIHKTGRLPKERLCLQDIGVSDALVPELLEETLQFFNHFLSSLNHKARQLVFEESLIEGQIPLPLLTLQQNHGIKAILQLHIELCKVLHLIALFSLKISKPIQLLFDAMSNKTFFVEINRELNYVLPAPDMILQKSRLEFLCKAVSGSMDFIREDLERLYVQEHLTHMQLIEDLADLWKLDKGEIKKHQIVELYAHGWDAYAEDILETVVGSYEMGPLLLEIAGRRLNLHIGNSGTRWSIIASAGGLVTDYLDTLKSKTTGIQITEDSDRIDLERIISLTGKSFQCLSTKDSKQLRVAGQMFDGLQFLKEHETEADSG